MKYLQLLSVLLLFSKVVTANDYISIENIPNSQDLSETSVTAIVQDNSGYIWIGTREGLNRYDGYSCKKYFSSSKERSLISSEITDLYIDSDSCMWVKSIEGMSLYDPQTDLFEKITIRNDSIYVRVINTLIEQNGLKWIGTKENGLIGYNSKNRTVVYTPKQKKFIRDICVHNDTTLWISHGSTIGLFDTKNRRYIQHNIQSSDRVIYELIQMDNYLFFCTEKHFHIYDISKKKLYSSREVEKVDHSDIKGLLTKLEGVFITNMITHDDKLWISTDGNGLFVVDIKQKFLVNNITVKSSNQELKTDAIRCIYSDCDQNIWIGTMHNGMHFIPYKRKKFYSYQTRLNEDLYPNGNFSGFLEEIDNTLWASTFDGLCRLDKRSFEIKEVVGRGLTINAISSDWQGNIYIGTYMKGLYRYDIKRKSLTKEIQDNSNRIGQEDLEHNINALLTSSSGDIWIGARNLYRYDPISKKLEAIGSGRIRSINCILEETPSSLWIGTENGLFHYNLNSGNIEAYNKSKEIPFRITHNSINCLLRDSRGDIWIGTKGGGLNRINSGNMEVVYYQNDSKQISRVVHGMVEDASQDIWFTTNSGLMRVTPERQEMLLYDKTDGLINKQYIDKAIYLTHSNRILCGGERGIDYFIPEDIETNQIAPKVIIEGIFYSSKEKTFDNKDGIYKKRLNDGDTLTLGYNQSFFGFEFTGIEYSNSAEITYAYQMQGINNDWIDITGRRTIQFGQIPSGEYTLNVKAANSDGIWSEQPHTVHIIVTTPFFKTPLAYAIYLILILSLIYLYHRFNVQRQLLKNRLRYESKERQRIEEMSQLKLRLFTHISHEFRTPLTLIMSPTEELIRTGSLSVEDRRKLKLIEGNAKKLQQLVDEVLEYRNIESGTIQLNKANIDIISFLRGCQESLKYWATKKNIEFELECSLHELTLSLDQRLMEKVIYNLLSNALKYTNEGHVKIEVRRDEQWCYISVTDTGIGIEPPHLERLFEMFYRVDEKSTVKDSGIGLSLCKEYVELHNGQLKVESELNKGSCFTVLLPIPTKDRGIQTSDIRINRNEESNSPKTTILIVDDNDERRNYLVVQFLGIYQIIEARNGVEALKMIKKQKPQLILSDVMIPIMDGWKLCDRVKTDFNLSHIPVVLLTALNDDENEITGYNTGADAYIPKPFSLSHLHSVVNNLLSNSEKRKEKFHNALFVGVNTDHLSDLDRNFLDKAEEIVVRNINDPEFSVQILSDLLAMSRSNLHQKLKILCNITPSDYILSLRLTNSIELLKSKNYRINEVAYLTGFSTPSHFASTFKRYFGGSPKDFLNGKIKVDLHSVDVGRKILY
ncbi:ATP-binding protein [Prolixibacteraceae bacterium]|nr:ATP-binding protein [Prolixibacteraceae bacterium]